MYARRAAVVGFEEGSVRDAQNEEGWRLSAFPAFQYAVERERSDSGGGSARFALCAPCADLAVVCGARHMDRGNDRADAVFRLGGTVLRHPRSAEGK